MHSLEATGNRARDQRSTSDKGGADGRRALYEAEISELLPGEGRSGASVLHKRNFINQDVRSDADVRLRHLVVDLDALARTEPGETDRSKILRGYQH